MTNISGDMIHALTTDVQSIDAIVCHFSVCDSTNTVAFGHSFLQMKDYMDKSASTNTRVCMRHKKLLQRAVNEGFLLYITPEGWIYVDPILDAAAR